MNTQPGVTDITKDGESPGSVGAHSGATPNQQGWEDLSEETELRAEEQQVFQGNMEAQGSPDRVTRMANHGIFTDHTCFGDRWHLKLPPGWRHPSCVTLGGLFNFSVTQVPHLQNGGDSSTYLRWLCMKFTCSNPCRALRSGLGRLG